MCCAVSKKQHTLLFNSIFALHGLHTLHNDGNSLGHGTKKPLTEGLGVGTVGLGFPESGEGGWGVA